MRNFRTLNIWQDSITIVKKLYRLAESLPPEEKYGLRSQMCRASVSIPANIAEGCSRNSNNEYKRFLEISIGSAFELETHLQIICRLNLVSDNEVTPITTLLECEEKMINSLITKIKAN